MAVDGTCFERCGDGRYEGQQVLVLGVGCNCLKLPRYCGVSRQSA